MKHLKQLFIFLISSIFSCALLVGNFIESPYFIMSADAKELAEKMSEKDYQTYEQNLVDCDVETEFMEELFSQETDVLLETINPLQNNVTVVSSNKSVIKERLLSDGVFSIDATVNDNEELYAADEYYNFAKYSKYEIAQWLYNIQSITEKDKIEIYCDLILNNNFENITCLTGVIEEIKLYAIENEFDFSLSNKIDKVLNPQKTSINSNDSIRSATTEASYTNDYFTIYYDASVDTYEEAEDVADYFNEVRAKFIEMGFRTPILEEGRTTIRVHLQPSTPGNSAGATHYYNYSNSNVSPSWMYFNFTDFNDNLKQVIAHEYFHAIQNAYNIDRVENETQWFKEACANWAKFVITGSISTANGAINSFITSQVSGVPLSQSNGYGAVVFPLILYAKFGGSDVIKAIYEEYNTYGKGLQMSDLRDIITAGMSACGHNGGFNYAYRSMAAYLYYPSLWYGQAGYTSGWGTTNKTIKSFENATDEMTFTVNIPYLTSQYFQIEIPENAVCMVEVEALFSNANGGLVKYRKQQKGHNIVYSNTYINKASYVDSSVGRFVVFSGFVLCNYDESESIQCTVNIRLTSQDEHFTFMGTGASFSNSRYAERRTYILEEEYADYTVTFTTAGIKLIQTFGELDAAIEIYDSSGELLVASDDEGYGMNALIRLSTTANSIYKIRVKFRRESTVGWVRFSIMPAYAECEPSAGSIISEYEDIRNFTGTSLSWTSYVQNNYVRIITFTPSITDTYTVTLQAEFDSYLYVIDPSSANLNIFNVDYNDDGVGYHASLTKELKQGIPYLIVFSPFSLSNSYTNNNITINITRD